ncbi:MAG TPA: glycosyl transferase family 1 [Gammaproteobacteria bacterium]|nr:glycosyl transferase family 1 [Gammaproteobacteria bacterium]
MNNPTDHRPLQIAFVFHRSDIIGGASIYAAFVAQELSRQGHSVRFFVPGKGHYTERLEADGLQWEAVRFLARSLNPVTNIRALMALSRGLRAFAPDLISAQASTAGALCRVIGPRLKVPVVYTPHSWVFAPGTPKLESTVGWMIERSLRHRTDAVIAVSSFERDLGIQRGVVHPDQITVIHNGLPDTDITTSASTVPTDPCRIICVARFETQKDQATLLRAVAQLPVGKVELVFVGNGSLMEEARELANELKIVDSIVWKGAIDSVETELLAADLFVLPTRWESLPLSIIEAMRAGLPVIASDVGGISEVVIDGDTGLVVPSGSVSAMQKAILKLVSDPDLLLAMGKAGRARFEQHFSLDNMIQPTMALYQTVAGNSQ